MTKRNDLNQHEHHDHSHHQAVPNSFTLAFAVAVVLNLGFSLVEIFYGLVAQSMGLLADAIHNLGDVLGLLFAWAAAWLLTRPAKQKYSYGYKRVTILAAIINALILVASSAIIAYEAVGRLMHGGEVNGGLIMIVALIGIFINGGSALLFMRGAEEDLNIKGAFLHLLYDAVIAVGVVISGVIIYFTGKMWVDPVVGLLVVASILWGTWGLLRDSVNLMLDAVPYKIDFEAVNAYLANLPNVVAVHDLHIWGLSTNETALTAHLVVANQALAANIDYHAINETLKQKYNINHATIQVEAQDNNFLCVRSDKCC